MSEFSVTFNTDNAAFQDGGKDAEVVRILRRLADDIEGYAGVDQIIRLHDVNGNRIGFATGLEVK